MALSVVRWSKKEFSDGCDEWRDLLEQSDADKLFMSWIWMHSWWQSWGGEYVAELCILAVYNKNELVGLAPLYLSRNSVFKSHAVSTRLEFLGCAYRKKGGIRTEYLQFIAKGDFKVDVNNLLIKYIFEELKWDEIVFTDLVESSETANCLRRVASEQRCYLRDREVNHSYAVDCSGDFAQYLSEIGRNTRLKFYNRRKLLEADGEVELVPVGAKEIDKIVKWLDRFRQERWGRPFFISGRKSFIVSLLYEFDPGSTLGGTLLTVAGEPVSVVLNFKSEEKVYNIQLAYCEKYSKKQSLGLLHLGYAIEAAFQRPDVLLFDLLAGDGKIINYKARIAKPYLGLESQQYIRSPFLKFPYRLYDWVRRVFHGQLNFCR